MQKLAFAGVCALALTVSSAHAESSADKIYDHIVAEVIVPGFGALADATEKHAAEWKMYCTAPSEQARESLVETFHQAADRWAEVEFFRSGPSSKDFHHERFYFWPERKNAVTRGLVALRAQVEDSSASPEQIAAASAAVQGLPALERLLLEDEYATVRCMLGPAISANAARLAQQMHTAWMSPTPKASEETRAALATDLVTGLSVIKDSKIEAVIGKSADEVKPRAAEFWRSGRSLRNISLNLQSLGHVTAILASELPEDAPLVSTTLQAQRIASSLSGDLAVIASSDIRFDAVLLRDAVNAAEDRAIIEIPAALGVTIGFNSLDGD